MSKVRNLPEITNLEQSDLMYAVDESAGTNGGRKVTVANLKAATELTASEVKTKYESNSDTNAFTDAEKAKLATIESGAQTQNANEVPYNNSDSGLTATDVQAAIDEINTRADADFRPSIVSGRILHYTGGTARFDGVFYSILPGDILLDSNVTLGEVYVDVDGLVKQTASGVLAPPYTIVFAEFSTDLNNIIALTDERVKNAQNIIRGLVSDVRDVRAGSAASEGSSGRVSDAMHKHNILTAAPSTQTPDQANAEGSSVSLARADHIHNIPADAPTTNLSPSTTNSEGVGASFARNDHTHAIATALVADISTIQPDDAAAAGVADTFARGDHKHAIASDVVSSQTPDQSNAEGVSTSFSRADHVHNIATAPAVSLDSTSTNTQGSNPSFARSNHTHAIASGAASSQTPDQANGAGTSANFAKADHVHNIPTAAAVGLDSTSTNTQGSNPSFARSNHTHAIASGAPSTQTPDQSNAAGSSANFAKADHVHNIPTATPATSSTNSTNTQGVASSFAKSDHIHNITVDNSSAIATADDTTASLTDTLIVGMSLTPAAGTYLATFSTTVLNSANGTSRLFVSLYSGGSQIAHSERNIGIAGGANTAVHTNAIITVNGSQAIEARWRAVAGTNTAHQRSLTLLRLS